MGNWTLKRTIGCLVKEGTQRPIREYKKRNYLKGELFLKFIEFGIGNTWLVRTETELEDGTEYEEKGIVRPIKFYSLYIRIWISKTVLIFDLKEGFKRIKKKRKDFKVILGVTSR